jgi:hypothetical protein
MDMSSKIFMRLILIIFCLFAFLAHSVTLQAEDQLATKTVVVIGTGKIYKKDSASARKEAIENSLVSAVESVALNLIPPESLNQTFQSFNEALYDQTGKFLQSIGGSKCVRRRLNQTYVKRQDYVGWQVFAKDTGFNFRTKS